MGSSSTKLNNRELVLKNFQHASVIARDGNYLVDQRCYDVSSGRMYTQRLILFEGKESHMRFFVREFSYHELAAWLWQVGFQHVSGSDREGHPFSLQSQRMIVVAEKYQEAFCCKIGVTSLSERFERFYRPRKVMHAGRHSHHLEIPRENGS